VTPVAAQNGVVIAPPSVGDVKIGEKKKVRKRRGRGKENQPVLFQPKGMLALSCTKKRGKGVVDRRSVGP